MALADREIKSGGNYWYRLLVATANATNFTTRAIATHIDAPVDMELKVLSRPGDAGPVRIRYVLAGENPGGRLTIYDVAGRRVRVLDDAGSQPGTNLVEWDRRDQDGRRMPRGVYFVRLHARTQQLSTKVVLARD
jgi:hypothetical protein